MEKEKLMEKLVKGFDEACEENNENKMRFFLNAMTDLIKLEEESNLELKKLEEQANKQKYEQEKEMRQLKRFDGVFGILEYIFRLLEIGGHYSESYSRIKAAMIEAKTACTKYVCDVERQGEIPFQQSSKLFGKI